MKRGKKALLAWSGVALAAALTACGGGGGGAPSAPVATSAALTVSNQTVVAQDTMAVVFFPLSSSEFLTGAQTTDESVVFKIARGYLSKLPTYLADAKAKPTLTGAVTSETYPCSGGGSVTGIFNDLDNNNVPSSGDSLILTMSNCSEAEGVINGSLGIVVNSHVGTFGTLPYGLNATLTFGNFTVASAQISANINGDLTLAVNVTGANASTESYSTPSLTLAGNYAGETRSRNLTNYSATVVRAPNATYGYLTSISSSGTLTSSALSSQSISFATSSPFVSRGSDYYPATGILVVSGANNSKLKLTALSNTQVRQELDANGDGIYESSTVVNWNSLI